ncbi:MAG: hypothetical protein KGI54_15005 [Pseudomonadota bacterium]|nr:hypothetical protein [Pseudomonadota bacterium]
MKVQCVTQTGRIGDTLCAIPFILDLAKNHEVYVTGDFSSPVKDLCHGMPFVFADVIPEIEKEYVLNCQDAWRYSSNNGWKFHMAQSYFGIHGSPIPDIQPIQFCSHDCDLKPGLVISPFAVSDGHHLKRWAASCWIELIEKCKLRVPIYVIGAHEDDTEAYWNAGAIPIQGWHLSSVLGLLKTCKCFVSIDTGTSHLAGLSGLKNHVHLYPSILPNNWVEYKTSNVLKARSIQDISVERVYNAVCAWL